MSCLVRQVASTPKEDEEVQQQEALLAGLLFALHPIHTEAVAGIVGQAELLCAALSILAFMAYMAAADGRYCPHACGRLYLGTNDFIINQMDHRRGQSSEAAELIGSSTQMGLKCANKIVCLH